MCFISEYIDLTSGWIQWFSIKAKVKIKQQKQNSEFIYQSSERGLFYLLNLRIERIVKSVLFCSVHGVHGVHSADSIDDVHDVDGLTMLCNRTTVFSVTFLLKMFKTW